MRRIASFFVIRRDDERKAALKAFAGRQQQGCQKPREPHKNMEPFNQMPFKPSSLFRHTIHSSINQYPNYPNTRQLTMVFPLEIGILNPPPSHPGRNPRNYQAVWFGILGTSQKVAR